MGHGVANLGTLVLILSALAAPISASADATTQPATTTAPTAAVIIPLRGEIDDYNRDALFRRFSQAKNLGAKTIVLEINTYGGLVTAGLDISRFLKRQNDVHVIAFVPDKAISAGAMIALACNEIVMGSDAALGDSAPISIGPSGMEAMGAAERAKMESPILADFRDSALRNGYDPLLAEAMVSVSKAVHWIEAPDGKRKFVDTDEFAKDMKDGGWKIVAGVADPIDSAETLLTVHSEMAVKLGLAKGIAASPEALASDRGLNVIATLAPGSGEKFVEWLGSNAVRAILMIIFLQAIYVAFNAPGHGAAEAVAILTLALLLGIPLLTGYAQWYEIVIIFAGLALLAFEIFVFPGHFVSGVVGALMVLGGLVMTFVPREPGGIPGYLPTLGATWTALQNGLLIVTGGLACSLFLWFWLNRYLPHLPYFNRLILATPGSENGSPAATTSRDAEFPRIGTVGRAITDLRPGGTAEFFDEAITDRRITDVISDSGYVLGGTSIVVREVEGTRIVVRPVTST